MHSHALIPCYSAANDGAAALSKAVRTSPAIVNSPTYNHQHQRKRNAFVTVSLSPSTKISPIPSAIAT